MSGGNNSEMIHNIISRKKWWKDCKKSKGSINFTWRVRKDLNYALFSSFSNDIRMFNRLENCSEISSKDNLFRNLWFMCNVGQYD